MRLKTRRRHPRALAEFAGKHPGQQIVINNPPGGGGTHGPGNPDGNGKLDGDTIAQFPMGMRRIAHIEKTAWRPINHDRLTIGGTGCTFGVVLRSDPPRKTFNGFIEATCRQPGKFDSSSTGTGTSPQLLIEAVSDVARGAAQSPLVRAPCRPGAGAAGESSSTPARCGGWSASASSASSAGPACPAPRSAR